MGYIEPGAYDVLYLDSHPHDNRGVTTFDVYATPASATSSSDSYGLDEVARAPESFALVLSGHHDHPDCNGRYVFGGKENGKPKRVKEGRGGSPKLFWTGHSWDCFWGGYSPESLSNTPVPPLDGYNKDKGGCEIRVSYERVKASSSADGIVKASSATSLSLIHISEPTRPY